MRYVVESTTKGVGLVPYECSIIFPEISNPVGNTHPPLGYCLASDHQCARVNPIRILPLPSGRLCKHNTTHASIWALVY